MLPIRAGDTKEHNVKSSLYAIRPGLQSGRGQAVSHFCGFETGGGWWGLSHHTLDTAAMHTQMSVPLYTLHYQSESEMKVNAIGDCDHMTLGLNFDPTIKLTVRLLQNA